MKDLMKSKLYSDEFICSMLDNEKILYAAAGELMNVIINEGRRYEDTFLSAYKAFKAVVLGYIKEWKYDESIIDIDTIRKTALELIIHRLPVRDKKEAAYHHKISDDEYGSWDAYASISEKMDVGEIYAAYIVFAYAENTLTDSNEVTSFEAEKETDKRVYLNTLKRMALDAAPFTGSRFDFYNAQIQRQNSKYLDDGIEMATEGDVVARFYTACHSRDTRMALKLLGSLRQISTDQTKYLESYVDYCDEEYEDALHYISNIERSSEYYYKGFFLRLECLAMMGNKRLFIEQLSEAASSIFSYDYVRYCAQLLIRNSNEDTSDIYRYVTARKNKFDNDEDVYYRNKVRRAGYQALIDGVVILREYGWDSVFDGDLPLRKEDAKQLKKLNQVAEFLFPGQKFFSKGTYGLAVKEIGAYVSQMIRDKYIGGEDSGGPNIKSVTIDDQIFAFDCLYEMGFYRAFCLQVGWHLDWFAEYSKVPSLSEAKKVLQKAYVESCALGIKNERLEAIAKEWEESYSETVVTSRMRNILPESAWRAYEEAEWQYQKSKEEPYGWKDAGMISLAYFRIIEMVLNKWFIDPLSDEIGPKIKSVYEEHKKDLSIKNARRAALDYKFKWKSIVNTIYAKSQDPDADNMMLGSIELLFKHISRACDSNEPVASVIQDHFRRNLTETAFEEAIIDRGIANIVKKSVRNKYRNPPAHCKYLPYETACECRDYTNEKLEELFDWTHNDSYMDSLI